MKCKVRIRTRISKRKPRTVTVRIDSEQQKQLLDDLMQRIEWSTNRIVDETKPCYISKNNEKVIHNIMHLTFNYYFYAL